MFNTHKCQESFDNQLFTQYLCLRHLFFKHLHSLLSLFDSCFSFFNMHSNIGVEEYKVNEANRQHENAENLWGGTEKLEKFNEFWRGFCARKEVCLRITEVRNSLYLKTKNTLNLNFVKNLKSSF